MSEGLLRSNAKYGTRGTTHWLYGRYSSMIHRCCDPSVANYHLYGGKGVTVCDEWRSDFFEYALFMTTLGLFRGSKMQVDRIDNDGDYCPSNVRLVTVSQNQMNTKRKNRNLPKGVYAVKGYDRFKASISKDGTSYHLGYFGSLNDAATAYNTKAMELFGEYALLNEVN